MSYIEIIRLALSAILAHKLRSFLTLLGVIFGVATVIVVVSLIEGFNTYVDEKISDMGPNAIVIRKFSIDDFNSLDAFEKAQKRNKDIKLEDLEAIKDQSQYAVLVGAQTGGGAEVKRGDEILYEVSLTGRTDTMGDIQRMEATQGSYFTFQDVEHKRQVCFVGSEVAERLFKTANPIGGEIKIDGRVFSVVGVSKSLGSAFGASRDKFIDIPLTTFQKIYGTRRSLAVYVQVANEQVVPDAVDEIRVIMRNRRHLSFGDLDNFGITTVEMISNLRQRIFGTIQMTAVGVTSIALVVGGIVIMNIMLVSVTERTREIGIRKSLGARRIDIIRQFLAESFVLALVGGAIGVTIAYMIALSLATFTPIPARLPLVAVFLALLVSGGVGIASGVYPAWRAASLDPIRALRAD